MNSPTERQLPSFAEALRFWLLLGCIGFGGPAGQIAIMQAELVERRRWIDETAFLRGLNFCMLLPGPEAMQLATWSGWRLHGMRGGIAAGVLFVLPASVLLALLAWTYLRFGHLPLGQGVVSGLQAAVLGVLAHAVQRIGSRVLRGPASVVLALAAALLVGLASVPFPVVVIGAGLVGLGLARYRPDWLPAAGGHGATAAAGCCAPPPRAGRALRILVACLVAWWLPLLALLPWLGAESTAWAMGLFFSKAALVTVGGAYAVLPYVAQQAVHHHGWLDAGQMMAGLGLAETTPGPLVLVLEFVGFVGGWQHPDLGGPLASAVLGAVVTLWATFLPSFLFVLTAAPWIERIGRQPMAAAALAAITAAVIGVIVQLALWFAMRLLAGQPPGTGLLAIGIAAFVWYALARRGWPVAAVVSAAGAAGGVARLAGVA